MNASSLRGGNDRFGLWIYREASNIFRDGARKKLDVLRKVANMLPQSFGRPLIVGCAIEPNLAACWLPNTNEHSCEARFARTAWTDNSQTTASLENKVDIAGDQPLDARWCDACSFNYQALARRLQ